MHGWAQRVMSIQEGGRSVVRVSNPALGTAASGTMISSLACAILVVYDCQRDNSVVSDALFCGLLAGAASTSASTSHSSCMLSKFSAL